MKRVFLPMRLTGRMRRMAYRSIEMQRRTTQYGLIGAKMALRGETTLEEMINNISVLQTQSVLIMTRIDRTAKMIAAMEERLTNDKG